MKFSGVKVHALYPIKFSILATLLLSLLMSCGTSRGVFPSGPDPGAGSTNTPSEASIPSPQALNSNPPPPFENQGTALAHFQDVLGQPIRPLAFVGYTIMINSPNADRQVAVYEDEIGARYFVDPSTNTLVQIEPSMLRYPTGDVISLDIIRQTAQDVALRSPGYLGLGSTLQYEESQKNDVYFFVWIDNRPGWKYNPPKLQVGVREDGFIITYMNTLIWAP